jgi:hypothetical protein
MCVDVRGVQGLLHIMMRTALAHYHHQDLNHSSAYTAASMGQHHHASRDKHRPLSIIQASGLSISKLISAFGQHLTHPYHQPKTH